MKTSVLPHRVPNHPIARFSWKGLGEFARIPPAAMTVVAMVCIFGLLGVSLVGLLKGNMYLCLEALFLAFIPYLIWSCYRRVGSLDIFAPDLGLPLAYIVYLTLGSIELPIKTEFGLTLPWIVWFYYNVGLVAYLVGVRVMPPPSKLIAAQGVPKRFWPKREFLAVTLALLAIGGASRAAIIATSGWEVFHANDEAARMVGAKGLIAVLSLCLDPAFECLLIYLLVTKPKGWMRVLILGSMAVIGIDAVGTTNRTALLRIVLAGVIVAHYAWKRLGFAAFLATGVLIASFASALGTFRDVSKWGDQHVLKLEKQGFTKHTYWLLNGYEAVRLPTEAFEMTIEHFPEIDPYTYGKTSLAEFGAFLPGHTESPSEVIKNKLRFQFVGFGAAATILAPLWADGGFVGIVAGMFLIGLLTRALHQRVLFSRNYVWVLVYAWYLQNTIKAIKDDIFPDIGLLFVIGLFVCVSLIASTSFEGWKQTVWQSSRS